MLLVNTVITFVLISQAATPSRPLASSDLRSEVQATLSATKLFEKIVENHDRTGKLESRVEALSRSVSARSIRHIATHERFGEDRLKVIQYWSGRYLKELGYKLFLDLAWDRDRRVARVALDKLQNGVLGDTFIELNNISRSLVKIVERGRYEDFGAIIPVFVFDASEQSVDHLFSIASTGTFAHRESVLEGLLKINTGYSKATARKIIADLELEVGGWSKRIGGS